MVVVVRQRRRQEVYPMLVDNFHGLFLKHRIRDGGISHGGGAPAASGGLQADVSVLQRPRR